MTFKNIGRYEVRAELGRGGMATVYHAYDPNFERDVAIKVLPEVFLHDPQFRARFEREAKTIALLEHPAIVPVYDFGDSDTQPFIVMRYMSGGTLGDRMEKGSLSLDDTAHLIARISPALDAAHARGIIHRDIKPGNILYDQYGNAFLSDFGIAHLTMDGYTNLTGASTLGTPAYMSPEQISGDKQVDGRCDIYAMGVLVFQMLTGQMPYSGDTPAKVMMMHVLQPVPQILDVRPDLPPGCDSIIIRAMAKNPDDRFATAGEMAEFLEATSRASGPVPGAVAVPFSGPTMPVNLATPTAVKVTTAGGTVALPAEPRPEIQSLPQKKRSPLIFIIAGVLLVILLGVGGLIVNNNSKANNQALADQTETASAISALLAEATNAAAPTSTVPLEATPTEQAPTIAPTDTPAAATPTTAITPTQVAVGAAQGGADGIAYLDGSDIWVANLDGSDRVQLTQDGASKSNLQWSNDATTIYYTSGKCIQSVDVATTALTTINCFNFTDSLKAIEISPDEKQIAISIDNLLYLVPFDTEQLGQVKRHSDLIKMGECKDFAPFPNFFAEGAEWSNDQQTLAVLMLANLGSGKRGNVIQILAIDQCVPNPTKINTFPNSVFKLEGYDENPKIDNFTFDGLFQFLMNNIKRNDGFGDMYGYNADLNKPNLKANPIDGRCCYRDIEFSPDGNYIVFAFQDILRGASSTTQLFYIPFGTMGTGQTYSPLPLPDIIDSKEKPDPALRPVQP